MIKKIIKEEFDKAFKKNFPEAVIIDGVDVAGCELLYSAYNENMCARVDGLTCGEDNNCHYKQLKRLEQELKWANDEEKYLKDCCIKAGKELEKYSFKWDGKEKNLVVQALQLNQLYEKLEQENKEVKEENKTLNYQWHKQSEIGDEWYKIAELCRSALEEIREIASPHCSQCVEIIDKINEVLGNESRE